MASIIDGWFKEKEALDDGYTVTLMVDKVLYEGRSKYQDILMFKNKMFGNVLVLDGFIQCTEKDEYRYHEMVAHLPLFCHENPKQIFCLEIIAALETVDTRRFSPSTQVSSTMQDTLTPPFEPTKSTK